MRAQGRDIEELELRVEFDTTDSWQWQLVGDARQLAREEAERDVLEALAELGEADAGAVAKELGKARQSVQPTLQRLRLSGQALSRDDKQGRTTKILFRLPGQK